MYRSNIKEPIVDPSSWNSTLRIFLLILITKKRKENTKIDSSSHLHSLWNFLTNYLFYFQKLISTIHWLERRYPPIPDPHTCLITADSLPSLQPRVIRFDRRNTFVYPLLLVSLALHIFRGSILAFAAGRTRSITTQHDRSSNSITNSWRTIPRGGKQNRVGSKLKLDRFQEQLPIPFLKYQIVSISNNGGETILSR